VLLQGFVETDVPARLIPGREMNKEVERPDVLGSLNRNVEQHGSIYPEE
jgi:hypothetical protein